MDLIPIKIFQTWIKSKEHSVEQFHSFLFYIFLDSNKDLNNSWKIPNLINQWIDSLLFYISWLFFDSLKILRGLFHLELQKWVHLSRVLYFSRIIRTDILTLIWYILYHISFYIPTTVPYLICLRTQCLKFELWDRVI